MKMKSIFKFIVFTLIIFLSVGCVQSGLTLQDEGGIEIQMGDIKQFEFVVENVDGILAKEYNDIKIEFVDDKWLVQTVTTGIDKKTLNNGDYGIVKVQLEGAKVGTNNNAKIRLTFSSGGKDFQVPLTVVKDPDSNITFKLSSLSPLELLAFNNRCGQV